MENTLVGKTIGRWNVAELMPERAKRGYYIYRCICGCKEKTEKLLSSKQLKYSLSCGCHRKEFRPARSKLFKNLTDKTFAMLKVIELDEEATKNHKLHYSHWKCICECGNSITVLGTDLYRLRKKSCGCDYKERASLAQMIDRAGEHIRNIFIISHNKPKSKEIGKVVWNCSCTVCGRLFTEIAADLKNQEDCGCTIIHGRSKGEKVFLDLCGITPKRRSTTLKIGKENKFYRPDGFCEIYNLVIEYDGDYYHGNKLVYTSEHLQNRKVKGKKTLLEANENTIQKQKDILEAGFNLISVWEYSFKNFRGMFTPQLLKNILHQIKEYLKDKKSKHIQIDYVLCNKICMHLTPEERKKDLTSCRATDFKEIVKIIENPGEETFVGYILNRSKAVMTQDKELGIVAPSLLPKNKRSNSLLN